MQILSLALKLQFLNALIMQFTVYQRISRIKEVSELYSDSLFHKPLWRYMHGLFSYTLGNGTEKDLNSKIKITFDRNDEWILD